jgi:hypothetical protein
MLSMPDSASSFSLSAKTSNKTSAIKSFPNMKGISRANWYFRSWMRFPKDLPARQSVPSPGVLTMP